MSIKYANTALKNRSSKLETSLAYGFIIVMITGGFCISSKAQTANATIQKGNEAYKKGDFTTAYSDYLKATEQDPNNVAAAFNLGNSLIKTNKASDAVVSYENAIKNSNDNNAKADSYYNEGLAYIKEKNLRKAAEAFKQSLRMSPNDQDARENLQKALNDLKKQQQQNQPQNKNQQQKQDQQQKQKKQPQSKMSQQMMEQKFRELRNQEKQLQKQLQQRNNSPFQPEKDW